MFESFNFRSTVRSDVDTTKMEFIPLKHFINRTIVVDGFFFTEGKFGRQVVIVNAENAALVNMPKRAVEQFDAIAKNDELVQAVLQGHLALTDIKAIKTKNGNTVSYKLADR